MIIFRSQDRKTLGNITIISEKHNGKTTYSILALGYGVVGTYESEDRCIEILNQIENALVSTGEKIFGMPVR